MRPVHMSSLSPIQDGRKLIRHQNETSTHQNAIRSLRKKEKQSKDAYERSEGRVKEVGARRSVERLHSLVPFVGGGEAGKRVIHIPIFAPT